MVWVNAYGGYLSNGLGRKHYFAVRVYDRLASHFGVEHVFRDIDTLASGVEFAAVIRERIRACDALLVIIGPNWVTLADAQGRRRLDDPRDLVRAEITEECFWDFECSNRQAVLMPIVVESMRQ
jgi:hypothetical protein